MILQNNTAQDVGWDGSWEGGGDCGSLGMGQSIDSPAGKTRQLPWILTACLITCRK